MSNTTPTPKQYSHWNVELKAFAVEMYMETNCFYVTIRDVVTKFNPVKPPYKSLIIRWVAKFRKEGIARNLNSKSQVEIVTQDERGIGRPSEVITKPLHSKVTVWCALSEKGIIGPYFFEENGVTTSINTELYIVMLERLEDLKSLFPKLELEQEPLDILAQNVVIKPRRQAIEVELTNSGVYHAADDVLEDEADVSIDGDSNMNQKPLTEDEISMRMITCERMIQ
ncbi:hypothetical protein LOD99_3682 [Oopsacas minuta]|uniref:DUF4817 domain-containing protein n=1 Tax=Oopsacas minuta TaxID=111878 RepID=A0AAV7JWS6_9METZ|nr:hypothetical protein LOD99_3682 [Oopsacas minuta]